jgi:hypothetical protein
MAAPDSRSQEAVRREIEAERARLAEAVDALRDEVGRAADVASKVRANLPVVAAGALGAGFVLAGGIGATMRLIFRRGRESQEVGRVGRFMILDRD